MTSSIERGNEQLANLPLELDYIKKLLARGDLRDIQKIVEFLREMVKRFGDRAGEKIF